MLKQTVSLPVKASRLPPMESTSRANCWAERVVVPLKTMCSTKWEMPLSGGGSSREPESIQTPMETERTWGMRSVRTSRPLGRTVRRMSRAGEAVRGSGVGGEDDGHRLLLFHSGRDGWLRAQTEVRRGT